MRIKEIKIRNFYSIESMELNLEDYSGITLIEGVNKDAGGSNGSGKSAILEAVCWGLTGKTIRKSNEAALVNNKNKKNCLVEILFRDGKLIRRQRKPTFLEFFIGKENRTKASVPATQKEIEEVMGFTYKSLLCTSFFGQHNGFDFLDATPEDKRTIINNFLNLDDLFEKRAIVKRLKSDFYQKAKTQLSIIQEHHNTIADIQKKKLTLSNLAARYEDSCEYLDLSLYDIIEMEKGREEASSKIALFRQNIFNLTKNKNDIEHSIRNPDEKKLCYACSQSITSVPIEDLEESLRGCLDSIGNLEEQIEVLSDKSNNGPVVSSKDYLKIQEYNNLRRDMEKYDEFLHELQDKVEEADTTKQTHDLMYEVMKFWERAFSEQGVVKYIIRNVLDYFNSKCNYYLSFLCNNNYIIEFDEELSEKVKSRGREVQYISLSGGEKRKVNLSVLMALKDLFILNDSYDSDFLFFDEIAENLDENGINGLFNLLQEIKKDKDIFVITHNKYLKSNLDSSNRITIIKDNGKSVVEGKNVIN